MVREDCRVHPICRLEEITEIGLLEEKAVAIEDIITKLCERAAKGAWTKHKGLLAHKSCSELFEETYLQAKLGSSAKIKVVQMIMFKHMCTAIVNADKKDMACVTGFAQKYPALLKEIADEHPKYFVNAQMVKAAITTDIDLQKIVLDKLNEITSGKGIGEGDYHEDWYEGKKATDQLAATSSNQSNAFRIFADPKDQLQLMGEDITDIVQA